MSDQSTNYWPESVDKGLTKLQKGDRISISWIDASQSNNVMPANIIANKSVETRIVSEGAYHCLQRGNDFNDLHIIIVKGNAEGRRLTVESIPLCLVKEIQVFRKTELQSMLLRKGKSFIRYVDGVIKTLRMVSKKA